MTNFWEKTYDFITRPIINFGDRIEVNDISGDVVKISARATTILTNDNITLIVPNSEFISGTVINWTNNDSVVCFRFDVGVSYNEDPKNIKQLLLEVAANNKGVLDTPQPQVLFDSYGDNALNFKLRVWTKEFTHRPFILRSELYYEIFEKFSQHGVEIPFPQRDIHIRTEQTKKIVLENGLLNVDQEKN
ncbi:MAG: mechanosensitive ion channel [Chitinophagales bacterium]|nr:mechanosensitive ion channel [Chitinophagales bacterium]